MSPKSIAELTIKSIYIIPSDKEYKQEYFDSIKSGMLVVQNWYKEQLNGKSFKLFDPIVLVFEVKDHDSEWFITNRCYQFTDPRNCGHCNSFVLSKEKFGDLKDHDFVRYAMFLEGGTDGAGKKPSCILVTHDLEGLIEEKHNFKKRWIGGIAHELANALNLNDNKEGGLLDNGYETCPEHFFDSSRNR